MNKGIVFLFMPFFMACGGNSTGTKTVNKDSLLHYARLADSTWPKGKPADSATLVYCSSLLQAEESIKNDTAFLVPLTKALYRSTTIRFDNTYRQDFVNNYERCLLYQQAKAGLSAKGLLTIYNNLGISYNILGEKKKTLHYYQQALLQANLINETDYKASALINKLGFFNEYGQYDSTIQLAPQVFGLTGAMYKRQAMAKAFYAEALYAKGNAAYGVPLQQASLQLKELPTDDDIKDRKIAVLKIQAQIALKNNQYPQALQYLQQALDTCSKKNGGNNHERYYAKLLLAAASVFTAQQQYDTALRYCQRALACVTPVDAAAIAANPVPANLYAENTIMEALDAKAGLLQKIYERNKDTSLLRNAITCYRGAFAVEQKLMENFSYDDSRLQMLELSKKRSAAAIGSCYELFSLTRADNWAAAAFVFSENSKALVLLEAIKQNTVRSKAGASPLQKEVDSLRLQLTYVEKRLAEASNRRTLADTAKLTEQKKLATVLEAAQLRLAQEGGNYKEVQLSSEAIVEKARQQLVNNQRSLVEFFCADSSNYIFSLHHTGAIGFIRLAPAVQQQVSDFLSFFTHPGVLTTHLQAYQQQAHELYKLARFSTMPKTITELLLVPDGVFNNLPFDALLSSNVDTTTGLTKFPYLLQQYTTSYGYSAASLLQQAGYRLAAGNQITAFAPFCLQGIDSLPRLAATDKEVAAIGHNATIYKNQQATLTAFRNGLDSSNIIHVASHAIADSMPRLLLHDGNFDLNELYVRHIKAKLVVLNACETNSGIINQSEGAFSLARGFYYAGAQHIIASLWKVDDEGTAALTADFYNQLSNAGYAVALQKTRQAFIKNSKEMASPYYWAAMIHIGSPVVTSNATAANQWWYIIAFGAAILILLLFLRKKSSTTT